MNSNATDKYELYLKDVTVPSSLFFQFSLPYPLLSPSLFLFNYLFILPGSVRPPTFVMVLLVTIFVGGGALRGVSSAFERPFERKRLGCKRWDYRTLANASSLSLSWVLLDGVKFSGFFSSIFITFYLVVLIKRWSSGNGSQEYTGVDRVKG